MEIDDRITEAGSMLAGVPVATPELERVLGRRNRRRLAMIIASTAVIAIFGITLLTDGLNTPPAAEAWTYELPLDGATPELNLDGSSSLPTETLIARTASAALWFDSASGRYLSLSIRPGLASSNPTPVGMGPTALSESFPPAQGQASISQSSESYVRTMMMWWARTDGAVWILRAYWYGDSPVTPSEAQQTLESWGLGITVYSSDDTQEKFRLEDASMELFAEGRAGDVNSVAQVWSFGRGAQQGKIILLTIENTAAVGLANLLAIGKPTEITMFGRLAWMVKDEVGQINIAWRSGNSQQDWSNLTIPPSISSYTSEILSALQVE